MSPILVNDTIEIESYMMCTNEEVVPLQAIFNTKDQIVLNFSHYQNVPELTCMFERNLVQKNQNGHGSFDEAYEHLRMEHSYCEDYIVGCCSSLDFSSLTLDECEVNMRNGFSENINVLFNEVQMKISQCFAIMFLRRVFIFFLTLCMKKQLRAQTLLHQILK